jgi:hypothetical protein
MEIVPTPMSLNTPIHSDIVTCYTLYMNREFLFLDKGDAVKAMNIMMEHNCPFHYIERYMCRDGKSHKAILEEQPIIMELVLSECKKEQVNQLSEVEREVKKLLDKKQKQKKQKKHAKKSTPDDTTPITEQKQKVSAPTVPTEPTSPKQKGTEKVQTCSYVFVKGVRKGTECGETRCRLHQKK